MAQSSGRPRPPRFDLKIRTRYGSCHILGNPTRVLPPDDISVALGKLGADIIDRSPHGYVLDIGTGSGVLLASVVMHSSNPHRLLLVGTDTDPRARSCARANVARAVKARQISIPATIQAGHLVDPVLARGQRFDLVFANLLPSLAHQHESDGFDPLRELAPVLPDFLSPGGVAIIRTPQELNHLAAAIIDSAEVAQGILYELIRLAESSQLAERDVIAAEATIEHATSPHLRTAQILGGAGIAVMHAGVPTHWERLPVQT